MELLEDDLGVTIRLVSMEVAGRLVCGWIIPTAPDCLDFTMERVLTIDCLVPTLVGFVLGRLTLRDANMKGSSSSKRGGH